MNLTEDILKEFEEKWNYASFTWNGDNKTGADFAKKTRKQIKAFLRQSIDRVRVATLEAVENEMTELYGANDGKNAALGKYGWVALRDFVSRLKASTQHKEQ